MEKTKINFRELYEIARSLARKSPLDSSQDFYENRIEEKLSIFYFPEILNDAWVYITRQGGEVEIHGEREHYRLAAYKLPIMYGGTPQEFLSETHTALQSYE